MQSITIKEIEQYGMSSWSDTCFFTTSDSTTKYLCKTFNCVKNKDMDTVYTNKQFFITVTEESEFSFNTIRDKSYLVVDEPWEFER